MKNYRTFGDEPSCLPSNRLCKLIYWTCRKIQFWLCFYDDGNVRKKTNFLDVEIEIEDFLSNPFNTQPPSLSELIRKTDFNKEWIMFMYRNFKQICSNGRMALQQWRRIFQLMFPKSANSEFADRVFQAIAGDKTREHITFEELILFLHRMSECYCTYASTSSQISSAHYSRIAKFVFLLMGPNDQEQINSDSFKDYAEAVYSLNIRSEPYNSHELFSQMHISDDNDHDDLSSTPSISLQFPPNFSHYTSQCFNNMDIDNDGFITVEDVKRMLKSECDQIRLFKEAHLLHS
uniref:EF-hand domain-containing protein n=1 Tax=Onchocerca volvulus TaxID=6282 RepID=A0A8R1XMA3_ONCVO